MSEKSSSSSSDEDVDPESGQPLELGGVLSKVTLIQSVCKCCCTRSPAERALQLCNCVLHVLCVYSGQITYTGGRTDGLC